MSVLNPRALKSAAADALRQSPIPPRKLVAIHTGITLVLALALTVIHFLLEQQIGTTGGLNGIGLRSALVTAQSILQLAQSVLMPFWSAGFLFSALQIHRRRDLSAGSLLEGFRRFGPILRLQIAQGVLYFFLSTGSVYLSSFLFAMSPWSAPLVEAMEPLVSNPELMADPEALTAALAGPLEQLTVPILLIFAAVFLVACVPMLYRFRLAQYIILEEGSTRALAAMSASAWLMKGNFLQFLKLDLSFWWYYLLELLVSVICYADVLISLLNISLPWSPTVTFFGSFVLYLICLLLLHLWKKSDVEVTYAAAYDALRPKEEPAP